MVSLEDDIFSIVLQYYDASSSSPSQRDCILGPIFLHNMFPFERYFAVPKKYVRNRARLEGSIAKGYVSEEVIEFCVDYVDELCPIGVPV